MINQRKDIHIRDGIFAVKIASRVLRLAGWAIARLLYSKKPAASAKAMRKKRHPLPQSGHAANRPARRHSVPKKWSLLCRSGMAIWKKYL